MSLAGALRCAREPGQDGGVEGTSSDLLLHQWVCSHPFASHQHFPCGLTSASVGTREGTGDRAPKPRSHKRSVAFGHDCLSSSLLGQSRGPPRWGAGKLIPWVCLVPSASFIPVGAQALGLGAQRLQALLGMRLPFWLFWGCVRIQVPGTGRGGQGWVWMAQTRENMTRTASVSHLNPQNPVALCCCPSRED